MPFLQSIAIVVLIRMPLSIITIPAIPTRFTQFSELIENKRRIARLEYIPTTAYARERSEEAKDSFKYSHPCPSNGNNHGSSPGYVIDHVTALACGGADAPANMQWQSVAEGKAKDKWERKGCQISSSGRHSYSGKNPYLVTGSSIASSNSAYFSGSRGGCFTFTASGNKRYVAHSFCGQ